MPEEVVLQSVARFRQVYIPALARHDGLHAVTIRLSWICPKCGGPRGDVYTTVSYDGSRRLEGVDGWRNPCGHVDTYQACRAEWLAARPIEATLRLHGPPDVWEERD
jgi:hypothetical protein